MIPFSLSWDTQKRSVSFKWNGLFLFGLGGREGVDENSWVSNSHPLQTEKSPFSPAMDLCQGGLFSSEKMEA